MLQNPVSSREGALATSVYPMGGFLRHTQTWSGWLLYVAIGLVCLAPFALPAQAQSPSTAPAPTRQAEPGTRRAIPTRRAAPVPRTTPSQGVSPQVPQAATTQPATTQPATQPSTRPVGAVGAVGGRPGSAAAQPPEPPLPRVDSPREPYRKPEFKGLTKSLLSRKTFFWSQMIGMLFALAVVVLLIYVILRWAAQRAGLHRSGGGAMLRVCDRLSLEAKKSLWVVEVAGQYLLLATHEQGVTLIERVDAQTAQEIMNQPDRMPSGFWERLRRGTSSQKPTEGQEAGAASASENPSKDSIPIDFEVVSDGKTSPPAHK